MTLQVPLGASCDACRWWWPDESGASRLGHCHRQAPSATGWPQTLDTDCCGEWESDYAPVERTGHLTIRTTPKAPASEQEPPA